MITPQNQTAPTMAISLTPDIAQFLRELARQQGTSVAFLARNTLREQLFPAASYVCRLYFRRLAYITAAVPV